MFDKIMTWIFVILFTIHHVTILTLAIMAGVDGGFLIGLKMFGCLHFIGAPVTFLSLYGVGIYIAAKLGYIHVDE